MKQLLLLIIPFILSSCGVNKAEEKAKSLAAQMSSAESSMSVAVWQQVNAYRASINKKAILPHRGLTAMTQEHAEYLSSTGGIVADKTKGFESRAVRVYRDYDMEFVTEYVYLGPPDPAAVISTWRADSSYAPNLKTNWNHCGVGVAIAPGGEAHVVMLTALKLAGSRSVGPPHAF